MSRAGGADLLDVARRAALAGGAALRRPRALDVERKGSRTSIVTAADLASQAAITDVIHAAYPGDAILAEEGTRSAQGADRQWIVDPLDGTTNFAHGLPLYCVSVAVREGQATVAGAVYDPRHSELFCALRDAGATCNGEPISVSPTSDLTQALVATELQSDDAQLIDCFGRRVSRLLASARGVRAPGSPALCLSYVASGRLDAFCETALEPWDVAAGILLVEEAGGRVTSFEGGDLAATGPRDVVASNGSIQAALLGLLTAQRRTPR